jgi:hypothetical protein
MKKIITTTFVAIFTIALLQAQSSAPIIPEVYEVVKIKKPIKPDANWNKKQWKKVKPVTITNYMGDVPAFNPKVQAKMVYDKDNLYVIFKVEDKYVKSITTRNNGPVYRDSAVEFFFASDVENSNLYFNIETNCGGFVLFNHNNPTDRSKNIRLTDEDIAKLEIAHSMPATVDPEITNEVTWIMEYKVPLSLLRKYSPVTTPAKGVEWRANFYKIAEITSNPHYITWSKIDSPRPNFHVPANFGRIIFK